jgi:photosystem II stability/assembly factor-like uncharacterized protein
MTLKKTLPLALSILLAACTGGSDTSPVPYRWKSVQIVGGGFVDGFIFHPSEPDLRYARTDMGGAYRWDQAKGEWDPILDWVSYKDLNLMGVESIAIDPHDANRVYLACGTYTNAKTPNGAILRSEDRGKTFQRVDVPIKFGGNENGRGNGERLVVDPRDGNVLFLATRHEGLWTSADAGRSWHKVENFPVAEDKLLTDWRQAGMVFVKFAPDHSIYVGQSVMGENNLFVSQDNGATWKPVPGQPTQYRPTRAAFTGDGALIVTYGDSPGPTKMTDGAVWRLDQGTWTEITPEHGKFGYAAVSADPKDPKTLIVSSFGRPQGEDIFRSLDGGKSWKGVFANGGQYDYSVAPYVQPTAIHWLFDIEIDPRNPDHAVFSTGYGGWETEDLTALDKGAPTHWKLLSKGIEETVGMKLYSPVKGVPLVSAIGDYGGFVHDDLDRPVPQGAMAPPRFSDTMDVTGAPLAPDVMVRVGVPNFNSTGVTLSYSLDAGKSWVASKAMPTPDSTAGQIAVSADGKSWLWSTKQGAVAVTTDHGDSWTNSEGIAPHAKIAADPVDPKTFYGLALLDGKMFVSHDGGVHFTEQALNLPGEAPKPGWRGDPRGGQDQLYASPGKSGDLWLPAWDGLYHSTDTGAHFERMAKVEEIHAFGFGKEALYLIGTVAGQPGVFRSTDHAKGWRRINDDAHQWGLVLQVSGDPKKFGRVYVGTHGRGIFYGDPVSD